MKPRLPRKTKKTFKKFLAELAYSEGGPVPPTLMEMKERHRLGRLVNWVTKHNIELNLVSD